MVIAMHCNLRPLTPRQSFSASTTTPIQWLISVNVSVSHLQRFYCLYLTLRCELDL